MTGYLGNIGTIDADYKGTISVIYQKPSHMSPNMRSVQLIVGLGLLIERQDEERSGGFGSTNKKEQDLSGTFYRGGKI